MIIFGNLASVEYLDYPNYEPQAKTLNIICHTNMLTQARRKLGLSSIVKESSEIAWHFEKNDTNIFLIRSDSSLGLTKIYENEIDVNNFKLGSIFLNYVWARAVTDFIHKNAKEWIDSCVTFSILHKKYFENNSNIEQYQNAISVTSGVSRSLNQYPLITVSKPYLNFKYSRIKTLEHLAEEPQSVYLSILENPLLSINPVFRDRLDLNKWVKLNPNEKISAVVERVYSDIANEIYFQGKKSTDIKYDFMFYLMKACVVSNDAWFSMFIKLNILKILNQMDESLLDYIPFIMSKKLVHN